MKHFLLTIVFTLVSISFYGQRYDGSNVHYFIPVGFSTENVNSIKDPYSSASILYVRCVIERGNSIYTTCIGNYTSNIMNNKQLYINAIERSIKNASIKYDYNSNKSTSKNNVYSRKVSPNMFGSGGIYNCALQKDGKQLIYWQSGFEDKRQIYYKIDINEILPKESNFDFLE